MRAAYYLYESCPSPFYSPNNFAIRYFYWMKPFTYYQKGTGLSTDSTSNSIQFIVCSQNFIPENIFWTHFPYNFYTNINQVFLSVGVIIFDLRTLVLFFM